MKNEGRIPEDVMEAAADWCDRADSLSTEERTQLHQWLAASKEHVQAFAIMRRTMLDVALLEAADKAPSSQNVVRSVSQRLQRAFSRRTTWGVLVGAVAIAACAVVFVRSDVSKPAAPAAERILATTVGQRSEVKLADRSTVSLNAETQVTVRYTDRTRQLDLTRGAAIFQVTKDAARPFRVMTQSATVTAVGTRFGVDLVDHAVEVRVFEGTVRVSRAGKSERAVTRGQWLILDPARGDTSGTFESDHYPDWRTGWLEADRMPLSYVIARLNRYTSRKIALQNASLSDVALTGRFRLDNTDVTLMQIAAVLDVDIVRQNGKIVLARRHE
jgi:transmembrane sensor